MLAVAYSGGRDSTALLHVAARQACSLGLRVAALHVHHGLSPQADAWLAHCRAQCEAWAAAGLPLEFHVRRLQGRPAAAQSVEAWAREGRYQALAEMAHAAGAELLLLAQHRRDQAETFVLQALRGAGAAGLAAMPAAQWRADGLLWVRPWLARPREAIEAYLEEQGLAFVDDDSNTDPRYARNRLRLAVWPALSEAFPAAEAGLAQAAAWAQQALELQREIADEDLRKLEADGGELDWQGLTLLSEARASNALRAWLQRRLGEAAPASLVRRLLDEGRALTTAAWPCVGGALKLYRGRLSFMPEQAGPAAPAASWLDLSRPGLHPMPDWGGAWQVEPAGAGGLPAALLARVEMRARVGGEQFQQQPRGVARSLKKCFQAAALPAWARQGPLLFAADGRLLYVPGLGADARGLAEPGEARLALRWRPDPVAVL
ncbi:tRNA lysidine(34) synthetase TilS [Roseateles sp. DAIF2]|uniref:tRNA lysidine(34) synthetase TilS n=1 Tax=Roseateles sp. DAIF2 TaxID=2714952 RepID=UPI00201DB7F4|nr:tRNA lysidine(34) synthetase TilS [Roseateles sp. DAIF2]